MIRLKLKASILLLSLPKETSVPIIKTMKISRSRQKHYKMDFRAFVEGKKKERKGDKKAPKASALEA